MGWDLHIWLSLLISFALNSYYENYLENHGCSNAESNVKEADVSSWDDVLHEKPVSHSLVILTEVPEIVHDTSKDLSWQIK